MDLNREFNSLYVYCDAADAIQVGDIKAPLLRVVDAAGKFGDLIHRLYTTPRYVPVSKKEFNTLEIDMKYDIGRPVSFQFDNVVATLQFGRSRIAYFLSWGNRFVAMLAEGYTKTIIWNKEEERYQSSTVHASNEGMGYTCS